MAFSPAATEIVERIRILIGFFSDGKPTIFADKVGINRATLTSYTRHEREPSVASVIKIAKFTGCDLNWLVMGEGVPPGEEKEGRVGKVADGDAPAKPAPVDVGLLADAVQALEEIIEEEGLKLTPAEKASRAALIYQLEQERVAKLSPDALRRLVKLS